MLLSINFSSEATCAIVLTLGFFAFLLILFLYFERNKSKKATCEHKWIVKGPMPIYQKDEPMSYRIGEPPIIGYSYLIVCEKCGEIKTETITIKQ